MMAVFQFGYIRIRNKHILKYHEYIEAGVNALATAYPAATVVLAGDFNTLDDSEVSLTAMHSIVNRPTRGVNILDRMYVNELCHASVRVVTSTVRSVHKAVVTHMGPQVQQLNKTRQRRVFRRHTLTQHAMFLDYAMLQQHFQLDSDCNTQMNFDSFYDYMFGLLNQFYPEREITVTSTDPHYVTPAVEAKESFNARRSNRRSRCSCSVHTHSHHLQQHQVDA